MNISSEALAYAFEKINNFSAVNCERPTEELEEAARLLLTSAGVDNEDIINEIWEHLAVYNNYFFPEIIGYIFMGIIIGLDITAHDQGT